MARKPARPGGGIRWGRLIRNFLAAVAAILIVVPVLAVIVYRFVPPPITILMVEGMMEGRGVDHRGRPLSQMSPALPRAAIADRAPRHAQLCVQHRLGNDAASPDRVEYLFLADDALPIADQEFQKIEHCLRRNRPASSVAEPKLSAAAAPGASTRTRDPSVSAAGRS